MSDEELKQAVRGKHEIQVGDVVRLTSTRGALAGFAIGNMVTVMRINMDVPSGQYVVRIGRTTGYCNRSQLEVIA